MEKTQKSTKENVENLLEELEILGEKRISEIRKEFIPMIGKKGFHYPLKSALEYIEKPVKNYSKYKDNFKNQFNKNNPFFREAKDENDYNGKYITRKIDSRTGKKEIYLSADGFKQFCAAQNTIKAYAVRDYFVRIESEMFYNLYKTPESLNEYKLKYENLIRENNSKIEEFMYGNRNANMGDFITSRIDKDLSKNIENLIKKMYKIETSRQKYEEQIFFLQNNLKKSHRSYEIMERQYEESLDENSYRAEASEIIRNLKMKKCPIYLINPKHVKKYDIIKFKNKSRKANNRKKITKDTIKKMELELGIFDSDSDSDSENDDEYRNKDEDENKDEEIDEFNFIKNYEGDPNEYEFMNNERSVELYSENFNYITTNDLDYDNNYFFSLGSFHSKNKSDEHLLSSINAKQIGVLDFLDIKHFKDSLNLLGKPHLSRPFPIYFTSWREISECSDKCLSINKKKLINL